MISLLLGRFGLFCAFLKFALDDIIAWCIIMIFIALIHLCQIPMFQYQTVEQAVASREALHGKRWPASNPKLLGVEFRSMEEVVCSVFSQKLQFHCNVRLLSWYVICCLSVCHLSVTRVYCDKIAEVRIMQFSLQYSPINALAFCLPSLMTKFEGSSLDLGVHTTVGWFSTVWHYISEMVWDRA